MKIIKTILFGIIAILMVSACNVGTAVVVTATPSQTPPITATTAATMTVAPTQTANPPPTTAVRVQPTAYIPNCSIRTDWLSRF